MQQIHEDKNKPTGKEIQVILTKVTWPYCSEEDGQRKYKQKCSSDCQSLQQMAERNTNQPKQIKCKTWLNKWFSQFQQVSVHGPDCSRSRGNCGTEEQDCCLFLGFCLESGPISPSPRRMGCSDAVAPEGAMERMPKRVCDPRLGPGCLISTPPSWRCCDYALTWLQGTLFPSH